MKIDKIQKLKNNKYKIIIDGESIVTFDGVILENNLLYKKAIDKELYNLIIDSTKYYGIYNKTINYILKKKRSENEIREYLIKSDLPYDKIEEIIKKLKLNNLINDIDYCKSYVNDCIYLNKKGINKIKTELLKQNISSDIIDEAIGDVDEQIVFENLEKQISKKINLNKKYSNSYIKQKILNEMLLLGYGKQDIIAILEKKLTDETMIVKNQFEKHYEKLSKKYSGVELERQIRIKLLSKGFNDFDITSLLQEKTEK